MINFENPFAFLFLFLVPVYYILRAFKIFSRISFPLTLSDWGGESFEWHGKVQKFFSVVSEAIVVAAYVCVVIALASPVMTQSERVYTSRGSDVMFVLDVSPSMAARDMGGMTRLEAAKSAIRQIVTKNTGAAFGIVALATEAAVSVPPTTDHETFLSTLETLSVGMLGDGSALGTGISTAVYHLIASRAPVKCIVLITDGENNAGAVHPETAAELAAVNGIVLHTLAVGTRGTVQLDYIDSVSGKQYTGFLESNFDVSSLMRISQITGGRTFEIQSLDALSSTLENINVRVSVAQTFYTRKITEPLYSVFVVWSMILFATAWVLRRIFLGEIV